MGSSLATWSILCFVLALALFVIEVFVPSGGVLGILAICCALCGIVLLFQINTTLGLVGAIVCVAAVPALMMTALKLWPSTPVGRWLCLNGSIDQDTDSIDTPDEETPAVTRIPSTKQHLFGQTGIAQTDLRPVGVGRFEAGKEPCVAVGGMIAAGTPIKVIAIENDTIKVQALEID